MFTRISVKFLAPLTVGTAIVLSGCGSSLPAVPASSSSDAVSEQLAACKRVVYSEAQIGTKLQDAYDQMYESAKAASQMHWGDATDFATQARADRKDADDLTTASVMHDADVCAGDK